MALHFNPMHVPSVQALALLCIQTRRSDEARALLEKPMKKKPRDTSLLFVSLQ